MGYLNYQIYARNRTPGRGDILGKLVKSGTITTSSTLSTAVDIPPDSSGEEMVGVFTVVGSSAQYVHIANPGVTPSGSGTHAAADTQPRILLRESDGAVALTLPGGGKFATVNAATFA